jgi:hypothetical protein
MTSPTQLSLRDLRNRGYTAQVVERFNPFAKVRQDLFGFIDIVAIREGENGVTGVQTTSGPNVAARIAKAKTIPALKTWLFACNGLYVHGWTKKKAVRKDGKLTARKVWAVREVALVCECDEIRAMEVVRGD